LLIEDLFLNSKGVFLPSTMKTFYYQYFFFLGFLLISCHSSSVENNRGLETHEHLQNVESQPNHLSIAQALPDDVKNMLQSNYYVLDSISGDLNLDEYLDLILVLEKISEEYSEETEEIDIEKNRVLMLFLGTENGELKKVKINDQAVYCENCGGMMGDPYNGITIASGVFSIEHYGGSAWRWTRELTFKYDQKVQDWYLEEDRSDSYHVSEPDNIETVLLTTKDFGRIKLENFNIYPKD
jgi:hypothetical protein